MWCQAISIKETQLIAALSCARLDVAPEVSDDTPIRVVSPNEQEAEGVQETVITEDKHLGKTALEIDKDLPANDLVTSRIEELSQWIHEDSVEPSANRLEADLSGKENEDSETAIVEDAISNATPNFDCQTEYDMNIDNLRTELPIIQSQPEPSEPHVPEEVSLSAVSTEASVGGLNGEGDWSDRGNYETEIISDISELKKAEANLEILEEHAQAEILEFDKVKEGLTQPIGNSLMQSNSEEEEASGSTKESSLNWAASDGDMGNERAQEELHGAFVQNLDNSLKLSEHIVNDFLYTTSLMLETVKDLSTQHQSMRIMYPQLSNLQDEESTGGDRESFTGGVTTDGGTGYKSLQRNVSYEAFVHDLYISLKNSEHSFDEISKLASPLVETLNELSKQLQNVRARYSLVLRFPLRSHFLLSIVPYKPWMQTIA